jgi:thymidylate synthase
MKVYENDNFADLYQFALNDLVKNPEYLTEPRGLKIKENLNVALVLTNPYSCLYKNKVRGSQLTYLAAEICWYFAGRNDLAFIEKWAKFWRTIKNADDTLNSAYGDLIFSKKNLAGISQWNWSYECLKRDKDSRQAILHFNTPDHQFFENKDFVCTLAGLFNIRDNKLNFTIEMRSNDIMLGLPTDIAFFCLLQQQMLIILKEIYPELEMGTYTHIVNSLHLYERDFELAEKMILEDFNMLEFPRINKSFINKDGKMSIDFMDLHDAVELGKLSYKTDDELFNWIYKKALKLK